MNQGEIQTADGRTVRYYDTGVTDTGLTLFWYHGTPQTGRLLDPVVGPAAIRGIRVVSCARPGYEGSTRLIGRSVADAASDVVAVADSLGVDRFVSVGASGGGPHALACAALAPDKVAGVVTFAGIAPYVDDDDWFAGMIGPEALRSAVAGLDARTRFAETDEFNEESFIDTDWAALSGAWGVLGADSQLASGIGDDGAIDDDLAYVTPWGVDLSTITAPVLAVQGELDRVVPAAHARWLVDHLASAELWLRPRDGHVAVLGAYPVGLDWLLDTVAR
jgi:pimeloyl-ACP methyl ester carboxylesterase